MQALNISNLEKVYSNGVVAVKGVNLTVEPGDFFALLGPNGAGKSTIIGIISSLVNKTSGKVKIFGHDLDTEPGTVKSLMSLVPQEFNFNQFEKVIDILVNQAGYYGVRRNVALERAEVYLRQLDLWEKRNHVSRSLSGGMKRRLMIARALVHEPKILFLDEPTAGVDIELRRSTWDFLRKINKQGTTIILTTHYLEEAENLCQGIAIIDKGQIIEQTKVKDLLNQLQCETILLDVKEELRADNLPTIANMQIKLFDPYTLEVTCPRTLTINHLFSELSQQNIHVLSMRNKSNRLEELFLTKIGADHASKT